MKLIDSIRSLFDQLEDSESARLVQAIQSLPLNMDNISEFIQEPLELEYGRNVIYTSDQVEVIVIQLPSMAKTMIHNHGSSKGYIFVVEGDLLNILYRTSESGAIYDRVEEYTTKDHFIVSGDTVHMMYNPAMTPAVTFHVYTPPVRGGQVYPS